MSYHLERMNTADSELTIEWITRQYGFDRAEVELWVKHLHFNWPLSVKAITNHGEVVGLLNMSDYRIEEETETMAKDAPQLLDKLNTMRYTAVFSFIVVEKYRGTTLNYEMMTSIMDDLKAFDFIFIPVMHHLKTHNYWQRWGALPFYRDSNCVYYMLPFSDKAKEISRTAAKQSG